MPIQDSFKPTIGLYEKIISDEVETAIELSREFIQATKEKLDKAESHIAIANHLGNVILATLGSVKGSNAIERQSDVANKILLQLESEFGDVVSGNAIVEPIEQLLELSSKRKSQLNNSDTLVRPDTPLAYSTLITGSPNDPSLGSQLRKEAKTCNRIDILCSFIRWSGLRLLMDELRHVGEASKAGVNIRVITTSYMGATDPKAIAALLNIPNLDLKVSYDTKRTRLHAKAYLFHRDSGFGCAYVGSANISNAALSDGLEWTTKVSQYELPHLWNKVSSTFESYWYDDEFKTLTKQTLGDFRLAIQQERRTEKGDDAELITFDLQPYPYQQEILDVIEAERDIQKKFRHLVVAATGTGKTMIAAFDYRRRVRSTGKQPKLLFVAHREEILQQALQTFRAVLRDHNFGELLVGKHKATSLSHLFCSIQTFASREFQNLQDAEWDYVVVDEFHHAAAQTYQNLLNHVTQSGEGDVNETNKTILLGLTATPERADGQDVFAWFGGEATSQIRLPDAINRRLLSPFQYFGISDSDNASLEGLTWQRGGYKISDLEKIYNGNDIRAQLVVDRISEYLADPNSAKALVFCVSIAHANFMSQFLNEKGFNAVAISSETSSADRRDVKSKLIAGEINFVCVVDLYNEGVDIREIDTVIFLRPTESLAVFLQQFGRGLRLHPDKECLTVLDFIGAHRKEFRFAHRFRALSDKPTRRADDEVEDDFPNLPSGCFIKLEKVAKQRVLDNIRANTRVNRVQFIAELKYLAGHLGRTPALKDAVGFFADMEVDDILKKGIWSRLLKDSGVSSDFTAPDEEHLKNGMRRIALANDPKLIEYWRTYCSSGEEFEYSNEDRRLQMFHINLWAPISKGWTLKECHDKFFCNTSVVKDVKEVLDLKSKDVVLTTGLWHPEIPLQVHAEYSRAEILAAFGQSTTEKRSSSREGVLHLPKEKLDLLFVDLHKSEKHFSPTTMYDDYVISDQLFHWQSQSTTSDTSPTGQRYINHVANGYKPLLFVRDRKKQDSGLTSPYIFLGPCKYVSHEGSRPISIVWRLERSLPARMARLKSKSVI